MLFIRHYKLTHQPITGASIKYYQEQQLYEDGFVGYCYSFIKESELINTNFQELTVDSFGLFPMNLLNECNIKKLELYCHIEMNYENFKILDRITENGGEIYFEYTGYSEWFKSEKRMDTITKIIS
ncbi:hypothetical protein NJT12_04915 [Flavobacterium sp. AC]|uniref:Uncharacterized protein n=1 Tax=Flavobacterium azizsancarii TaxID=2961580 RepID=A0ABT4W8S7_9FLAO|nr:hypothetical protein [Flavobacterium azizsancarii]MDA6068958.1 hypothetical protein [Flavobacterium azizsancarii]